MMSGRSDADEQMPGREVHLAGCGDVRGVLEGLDGLGGGRVEGVGDGGRRRSRLEQGREQRLGPLDERAGRALSEHRERRQGICRYGQAEWGR
jgi:hypothetical protein